MMADKKISPAEMIRIQSYFLNGASAHQVALQFQIPYEMAQDLQKNFGEDVKNELEDHKVFLRNMIRIQIPNAVRTLVEAHTGTGPENTKVYKGATDAEVNQKIKIMGARVAAARALLTCGKDFLSDSIFTALQDNPGARAADKTIFDFSMEANGETGALTLTAERTPLHVVKDSLFTIEMESDASN